MKIGIGVKTSVIFTTVLIVLGVMILVNRVTFLKKLIVG